jgi:hypothetical protein
MELKYIKPRCAPFYYDDAGEKIYALKHIKGIAYLANGLLAPCCWCDQPPFYPEFEDRGMRDEKLKLENNNSVDDILNSDEWKDFMHTLWHNPKKATTLCQKRCGIYNE